METVQKMMQQAWQAYQEFSKISVEERVLLMKSIGEELLICQDRLIDIAHQETNLSKDRLKAELNRTVFQLNNYADAALSGQWMDIRVQNEDKEKHIPDIIKMNKAIGPVMVFGASNFPFAYSTAGGDTASALAAGCSVIVKAHEAHLNTSKAVADCIKKAILDLNLPEFVFQHFIADDRTDINTMILHPNLKAIGFTGSFTAGNEIWKLANSRKVPIPVFAEMSSVNPVCILPKKLHQDMNEIASLLIPSILTDAGQFCTNPGIILAIDNEDLDIFFEKMGTAIESATPLKMLHRGIAHNFREKRNRILMNESIQNIAVTKKSYDDNDVIPTIVTISAADFLLDDVFCEEVFGSFTLVVKCKDLENMIQVLENLPGQLTTTLFATEDELRSNTALIQCMQEKCGRFIFNGVPTGVTVTQAMHHGGPWPATTDSRFTSVGADAIKRFVRPIAYQNWLEWLLPKDLQTKNYSKNKN